jgi:hypothetical protein
MFWLDEVTVMSSASLTDVEHMLLLYASWCQLYWEPARRLGTRPLVSFLALMGSLLVGLWSDLLWVHTVGILPQGYVRNVPLPMVPQESTQSRQVHTIPDYYGVPYVVLRYNTPCSIVESAAYACSPSWQAIAINT